MAMIPPLVKPWQKADIANSSATGYFTNPVSNVANIIGSTAVTLSNAVGMANLTSIAVPSANAVLANIASNIGALTSAITPFLYLTNRQSNIVPVGNDLLTPHYTTAIGNGKILSYLTNQTDGVQNNSCIMGNFTSITLNTLLYPLSNTLIVYTTELVASISANGTGNVTTMSLADMSILQNTVLQLNNYMIKYPAQDTQFFRNSQNVVADFNAVSQFSNIGQSETSLMNSYIGTPKLVSRLNS
jgi:hypothetical protein